MAKRKNFGLKNFFFSFAAVCIVIYIFQNLNGSVESMVAENGNLENVIIADGIVVKDERVYNASVNGSATYYYEDGAKIKSGQLVADLNTDMSAAQVNQQMVEIQAAIDMKKSSDGTAAITAASSETAAVYENEIQLSILNSELNSVYALAGQVSSPDAVTVHSDSYEQYGEAQLIAMKESLAKSISTQKVPYYSGQAGLITYKIDGLENEYKFENVLSMTPSSTVRKEYTVSNKSNKETMAENESMFKIIRNFEYYIAATVDNEKAKLFSEKKYVKTRVLCDGASHEVWGYIEKINYGSEQSVLILYFDDFFYKIYDKRYVDLELITDIYEGLKIKTEALTQSGGLEGVYVQDASNIIKFFPVEILGRDDKFAIISSGEYIGENERRIIKINEKSYHTVKIFDKIILEPDKVYDGQIAD